jgi:hypothetical protein
MPRISCWNAGRSAGGITAKGYGCSLMLYMIIERFKNRDAKAVYRRFLEKGRMAPDGLVYVESWVETNFDRCFQLMECGDVRLLELWADHWRDLADFEFVPVRRSKDAVEIVTPEL